MKYRTIKKPPGQSNISLQDAIKWARAVARNGVTGRVVSANGNNSRAVGKTKAVKTSPGTKLGKSGGKAKATTKMVSRTRMKSANKQ